MKGGGGSKFWTEPYFDWTKPFKCLDKGEGGGSKSQFFYGNPL